jgi:hypothetical protein
MSAGCIHKTQAKDEHQANLLPAGQLEADDEGDGKDEDDEVGDDVGVRVPDIDPDVDAFALDRLVPHCLEWNAVDEGRDDDPYAAGGDDGQDDGVADACPAKGEKPAVQQQNGDLGAGKACCVK